MIQAEYSQNIVGNLRFNNEMLRCKNTGKMTPLELH